MSSQKLKIELYETAALWTRLFNNAVKEAQAINHQHGMPNIFSRNGKTYYEYPDGRIVMKKEKKRPS